MYGFIDCDLLYSKRRMPIPNLEIMKLMAYYQEEKKEVCHLLLDPAPKILSIYERVFVRSDFCKLEDLISRFPFLPSMTMGGKTFAKTYIPLEEELMEYMIPDPFIYQEWADQKVAAGELTDKERDTFLNTPYFRAYYGSKRLPPPLLTKKRTVLVYDEDFLAHSDWQEVLETLKEHCRKVDFLYPLLCRKMSQVTLLQAIPHLKADTEIVLDFSVPEDQYDYFIRKYKGVLLQKNNKNPYAFYLGKNYYTDDYSEGFFAKNLYLMMRFLKELWKAHIPVKLILWENAPPNEYDTLLKAVAAWSERSCARTSDIVLQKSGKGEAWQKQKERYELLHPAYANFIFNAQFSKFWEE